MAFDPLAYLTPAPPSSSKGGGGLLSAVGDLLGGPEQGVLQLIQGAKTGNMGDVLRGAGILTATGAGALLGGPVGALAGGRLAEYVTDRTDDHERLDPVETLGLPQFHGVGGLAEHIGVGAALDPAMYLTGGASEVAQAGDEVAQGASQALRLRVPMTGLGVDVPQGLVDSGTALRQSALQAVPNFSGGSLADTLDGVKQSIATAVNPQAYRAAELVKQGIDPERAAELAAKGGLYDTAAAQAKALTSNSISDFDRQAAAVQKSGGDLQGFLQQSADKVGLSLDGSDGLSLADVRQGVVNAAVDSGKQAFGDYLESQGIPRTVLQKSAGDVQGVQDMSGTSTAASGPSPTVGSAPPQVPVPDTGWVRGQGREAFLQSVRDHPFPYEPAAPQGTLSDIMAARAAGPGTQAGVVPDAMDRVNQLTGHQLTRVNPESSSLQDLFANRPSLQTGKLNQLYRQANLANPLSQAKYALGDVARNALDQGISGIGDVGDAARIQWALHSIPDEAIAAKGVEGAARDVLTPEQFSTWQAARQQGVLSSGYQADTSASGVLGRLASPLRAEGDNARLANFMDRLRQGASPEEAAAGARSAQYDLSDTTPTIAAARRLAIPGANFMAHNLGEVLPAVAKNPALAAGVVDTETAATKDPNAPGWVTSILTGKQFETPLQSAVLGNNPVTGVAQMAGGDVKGGMATLGNLPGGPTPVGALHTLYKASQHKGTAQAAIDEALQGTVPGLRQVEPVAMAGAPTAAGGQGGTPFDALQALLSGGSTPSSSRAASGPSSIRSSLTRAGIHISSPALKK